MMRSRLRLVGSCGFVCFALFARAASQGNDNTKDLVTAARQYEQSGDVLKAAATYELIVKSDPTKSLVLAPRLAQIYAESGQTNKALAWANEVMKTNPEPQAYLAGIYSLLGDQEEARKIIEKELGATKNERRKLVLRWQLAEVYEKKGDMENAIKILQDALSSAKGTSDEAAARLRLEKLQEKVRAKLSDVSRKE